MIKRVKKGYVIIILLLLVLSIGCFVSYVIFKNISLDKNYKNDENYYICEQELLESSDPNISKLVKGRLIYYDNDVVIGIKSFSRKSFSNERAYLQEKSWDVGNNFEIVFDDSERILEIREITINELNNELYTDTSLVSFISSIENDGYVCIKKQQ